MTGKGKGKDINALYSCQVTCPIGKSSTSISTSLLFPSASINDLYHPGTALSTSTCGDCGICDHCLGLASLSILRTLD